MFHDARENKEKVVGGAHTRLPRPPAMENKTIAELQHIIRQAGGNPDNAQTKEDLVKQAVALTRAGGASGASAGVGGGGGGAAYAAPVITQAAGGGMSFCV